jgi:hypothetical protein
MKIFIAAFALILSTTVFAQSSGQKSRFSAFKQTVMNEVEAMNSVKTVRVSYDFAKHGGAVSTIALGKYLPAGALIIRSFIYVETQLVDAGAGTTAITCEDANNIKTATDLTGSAAGAFIEGASTGSAATMVGAIAARCEISIVIAGAANTAGALTIIVQYVKED